MRQSKTIVLFIILLFSSKCFAQSPPIKLKLLADSVSATCGADVNRMLDMQSRYATYTSTPVPAFVLQSTFPSSLTETCGSFRIYYEDYLFATQLGFADPVFGSDRRNTLCAVLNYLENIINIPTGVTLDLYVSQSLSSINPSPVGTGWLGRAGPYYVPGGFGTIPGFYGGNLYDHITTGTDPDAANYDAHLQMNFDYIQTTFASYPVPWWNDYQNTTQTCAYDLYSVLLHEMGHTLGWLSAVEEDPTGTHPAICNTNNSYTKLDEHFLYYSNDISTSVFTKIVSNTSVAIDPAINSITNPLRRSNVWLLNNGAPSNQPVYSGDYQNAASYPMTPSNPSSLMSHMNDGYFSFLFRSQLSPGYQPNYVMAPAVMPEMLHREWTLPELRALNQMGYTFNYPFTSMYSSTGSVTAGILGNLPPAKTNYNPVTVDAQWTYTNSIFPDVSSSANYSIAVNANTPTNTTATQLVINLSADPAISDANGDPISVFPNSLFNIRGCGSGGNNHNCLVLTNNNQTITYTPRPGFSGRALFGLYLSDGTERGAFKVYSIDVQSIDPTYLGTITSMGNNLIMNPGFEEGTEFKLRATDESIENFRYQYYREGIYLNGSALGDNHFNTWNTGPYNVAGGTIIGNSWKECSHTVNAGTKGNFGVSPTDFNSDGYAHFSWPANPLPSTSTSPNDRYSNLIYDMNFSELHTPMQTCHRYRFSGEFNFQQTGWAVGSTVTFSLNFVQPPSASNPHNGVLFTVPITFTISTTTPNQWQNFTQDFNYCGGSAKFLNFVFNFGGFAFASPKVDNISIIEIAPTGPASVSISNTSTEICSGTCVPLSAITTNTFCSASYTWMPGGAHTASINACPLTTTIYTLSVFDGCITTTAVTTVSVAGLTSITASPSATLCSTKSVTLTASGSPSYTWSTGENTPTIVVSPTITTTYTVNGTSVAGCNNTSTITVVINTVATTPTVAVSNNVSIVCGTANSFTVASGNIGNSYNWEVFDTGMTTLGLPLTGGSSSVATIDFSGVFQNSYVCATITTTNGCAATSCATVLSCCQTPSSTVHYTNTTFTTSTVLTGTASVLYQFSGTITVASGTLEILEADVTLDPYTMVIVNNGAHLRIAESYLHGCGSVWRSIVATGNSTVEVTGSWIEDGIEALVDTTGGATLLVNGNYFNRNVAGIVARATKTNTSFFDIKSNLFTCSTLPVPTPFPYINITPSAAIAPALYNFPPAMLAAPYQNMGSRIGVYLFTARQNGATESMIPIGSVNNGEENVFDKLQIGIAVQRSSALLQNNYFQNIRFSTNPGSIIGGVHVQSNAVLNASPTSTVQLGGSTTALQNTFVDCDRGLMAANRNRLHISNNTFSVQTTGIEMTNNYNGDEVEISTNHFDDSERGILFANNPWVAATIAENRFDNATAAGTFASNVAITMAATTVPLGSPTNYGNYTVFNNRIDGYYNGINCTNTYSTQIIDNEVHMRPDNTSMHTQAGIRVDGARFANTERNEIDMGSLTLASADWQSGIWYNSTPAPFINCNTINNVPTSLRISGQCNTLANTNELINNRFSNAESGLWLDDGDFNANQAFWTGMTASAADNEWTGTMTQRTYATGLFGNASSSQLHTQSGINFRILSTDAIATGVAIQFDGTNSDVANGYSCASNVGTPVFRMNTQQEVKLLASAHQIADGSLYEGQENSEDLQQLNNKYLLENILLKEADVSEDGLLRAFVQDMRHNNTGAFCKVDSLLQLAGLEGDSLGATAQLAQAANHGIVPQNLMEENQVLVNGAYINLFGSSLSTEQVEQLRELAIQCPDVAGHAVFQARALLMGIDHVIYSSHCSDNSKARKNRSSSSALNAIKVYPNPAADELKIELVLNDDQKGSIEIYSLLGSLVKIQSLQNGITTLDTRELNSGTYFYSIKTNGKASKQDKLIIIK